MHNSNSIFLSFKVVLLWAALFWGIGAGLVAQGVSVSAQLDSTVIFIGGQIGSRLGVQTFNTKTIKRITALLILIAGGHIIYQHW